MVENVFGYPQKVWQQFLAASKHAGVFPEGTQGLVTVKASNRATASTLSLHFQIQAGMVQAARFAAFGCPVGIAVGAWLAARAKGLSLGELRQLAGAELRAELEIPDDKLHCALMGEDALAQITDTP